MNRLAAETSLYLRQHADNPVHWFPWGDEALAESKRTGKPIFLSIGYSACHWCHVMAHESFEDAGTAAVMNEHFVNVKLDREERPDLDQLYMTAHGLLSREGGGWPLSVWLTPDLRPFYAGTYFPPSDKYGRPSFRRVLLAIAQSWHEKREKLEEVGAAVATHFAEAAKTEPGDTALSPELLTNAAAYLNRAFDDEHGGFGRAPKFPHALDLQLLLRTHRRFGRADDLKVVSSTLDFMARGGIYDQVGGGFHRYSVDRVWLVPHFEKMLYDNAQLPPVYVEAYQVTGDPYFAQIARETLDYILREMTSEPGGFFSTQDADSEGEEGKFFVWGETELDAILGPDLGTFAKRVFGTSPAGNFEGHNILHRWRRDEGDAEGMGLRLGRFRESLEAVKHTLYDEREKRVKPGRDEKILTSWNGLMIHAMAFCGAALDEPKYVAAAAKAAEFVLANLRGENGRLFRTCGVGTPAKLPGFLDDYAFLAHGLVSLYEATFDPRWLAEATALVGHMNAHFADPAGGYYYTADDHDVPLARTKDMQDGSIPSANATAALAMLRLSHLTGRDDFRDAAERTINAHAATMAESPMAAAQMLIAYDFLTGPVDEVAVIGRVGDTDTAAVLKSLRGRFHPNRVIAFHDPASGESPVALLKAKPMRDGRVTTYVCRERVCGEPTVGFSSSPAAR